MSKLIVLLASGTRGDVQPYIALGLGLISAGYRVRVATHTRFRSLVERHGLESSLLGGNPSELLMQPGWKSALTFDGNWSRGVRASLQFIRAARPMFEKMLGSGWESCQGADSLIAGLPTLWGAHIAEALDIPCYFCFLQPLSRTSEFPSPLFPSRHSFGSSFNHLSYWIVEQALWQPWRASINNWRRKTLRLRAAPLQGIHQHIYTDTTPVIYGFSERVVPRPADWPRWHEVAGYWFLEEKEVFQPPRELQRFIEAGDPSVYIGFGSTGVHNIKFVLALLDQALKKTGLRAVVTIPGSESLRLSENRSMLSIQETSHDWLFPRVAALVHHGGAGTTASGLRAGVPAFVTPQYADQFFWGQRIADLGVGPRPIPLRALSADGLAGSLERMIADPKQREKAREIGREISSQAGVQRAVEIIQRGL